MSDRSAPDARVESHSDAARPEVELSYRRLPMLADYCRGWAGFALAALPLVTMTPTWPVSLALLALMGLFLVFLVQTWRRQHSRVLLAPSGVALSGDIQRRLAWRDLDGLRLRWFGSRNRGRGWLELELRGGGERLVLTSALDHFDELVAQAVQAANDRGLPLEPATRANVDALLKRAA
jgi:hypothetical protein